MEKDDRTDISRAELLDELKKQEKDRKKRNAGWGWVVAIAVLCMSAGAC